ncbi:MAG: hypothetical protein MUF84_00585 [Anaerolineae bacterium]|nr:hypothetical protein [Anaerolineae bacterium]
MRRTVPKRDLTQVTLYMRTYYSLLRTTDAVQIRTLEETHIAMKSSLHPNADGVEPDMSAFVYASLRLPKCILDVQKVVLGQSQEVFRRRDYPDVESWEAVSGPARRRRMFYDGHETLAVYIASISDIDDIVPMLTAFQIEWNKMHTLIGIQAGLAERLRSCVESESSGQNRSDEICEEVQRVLQLAPDDWERLQTIWGDDLLELLQNIGEQRKRMSVMLLAGSYVEYLQATQKWWDRVNERAPFDLSKRPTYFVSSNTHSLSNMITGFAQGQESRLMDYVVSSADPELCEEADRIRRGKVPSNWSNFLYYTLKKYMQTQEGRDLLEERNAYEAEHGVMRIPSQHTFDLEVQIIDLSKLDRAHLDPRLVDDLPLDRLIDTDAIILNIDYPLGFAAYHLLSRIAVNVGELRGAYVLGKAATLSGRIGDVLIPNVVYDEHSSNTYLFNNVFTARHVAPYLVYGDVLDNQRAISVHGTFLQNRAYMEMFFRLGYTDVEMESGPYLSALYEFIRPRRYPQDELVNLYPVPFEIGVLHYASDTPMSKGRNLGTHNLSYYGMDPAYATTVAVLRRILALETAQQTAMAQQTATGQQHPVASGKGTAQRARV